MKAKYSFVCDAANISQTGNLNVLGIFDIIQSLQFPCQHPKFMYVSHIEFHRSETGIHKFKLTFIDEDGKDIIPPINGELNIQPHNLGANIIMELANVQFPAAGIYEFNLTVDNVNICSDTVKIVQIVPNT
jgi:hypothetical protein